MDKSPQIRRDPQSGVNDDDAYGREREARLASLRAAVRRGLDDVKAGRIVDLDEGIEQVLRSIREKKAAGTRE